MGGGTSPLRCPHCGSAQVSVTLCADGVRAGSIQYDTGIRGSWFLPAGFRRHRLRQSYKSVAVCQSCGHTWTVQRERRRLGCLGVLVLAFLLLGLLGGLQQCLGLGPEPAARTVRMASVWAADPTPLAEFDYYVDGDALYLRAYTGHAKAVNIAPTYLYEGRELPVAALAGSSMFPALDSLIVPEGVGSIENSALNGCTPAYLYLPATLKGFDGWSYLHGTQKLYYGGSEADWAALYTGDRARLDVVEVVCGASLPALLAP